MPKNDDLQKRRDAAIARGIANQLPVFVERARNAEIWDAEGRRYIDFAAGIAVVNTGHVHPAVHAAAAKQLEAFTHTCFMVTPYEVAVELAERLNRLAPGPTPKKSIFVTTGAEAVENAIKIARAHTGRSGVIAFGGGFHGRTFMAMALTGKVAPYKADFGPFPAEIYHAPFPIAYHGVTVADSLAAVDHIFKFDIDPARVAAIIVEPVMGEGGFYIAPPEFLQALRRLCDQHGILLIIDEIQTGFARTGRMFAIEYSDIEPDLMTLAKSLAGGFPLAAVVGKAKIMDAPAPGGLGGTYAGSPVACAAGLAVLKAIEAEGLCERAEQIGSRMMRELRDASRAIPAIGEVRGLGAMVAIELVRNGDPHQPDADLAKALVKHAASKGLVILSCGLYGNVIRFLVPVTASDEIVREGLGIVVESLGELTGARLRAAAVT
jgi:4-aminobutyrate aminotransferase/(S)-3-amino-2-methylpropionate transaminase